MALTIGAVSYLNTKPLIHGLHRSSDYDLVLDLPSRLADQLALGQLDVALIPVAEYFRFADYDIVSDACIACRGDVMSVKLFSRVVPERITTLALDEGSRTSALMAQIILSERFGVRPALRPLPIGYGLQDADTDAVLLIGDRAIGTSADGFEFVWDLGAKWCEWYSPSFVFAVWAARRDVVTKGVAQLLSDSRDQGLAHLDEIAKTHAQAVGLTEDEGLCYLRDKLHFVLGDEERVGMKLFAEKARQHELAVKPG